MEKVKEMPVYNRPRGKAGEKRTEGVVGQGTIGDSPEVRNSNPGCVNPGGKDLKSFR